ncbi:hypothetical protein GYH30_003549 [Glycine max]|nr:hypothetical protein GYH30_003549 [Glycine max]
MTPPTTDNAFASTILTFDRSTPLRCRSATVADPPLS